MSEQRVGTGAGGGNDLTFEDASKYLELAGEVGPRPVDDLIEHIEDEPERLLLLLEATDVFDELGPPSVVLTGADASLDMLREVKSRSRRLLARAGSWDDRLAALACYFLSLGAALRVHGALIGGPDVESLRSVLLDLATVAPEPYAEMFGEAALATPEG